jgi:hypothetical protein
MGVFILARTADLGQPTRLGDLQLALKMLALDLAVGVDRLNPVTPECMRALKNLAERRSACLVPLKPDHPAREEPIYASTMSVFRPSARPWLAT